MSCHVLWVPHSTETFHGRLVHGNRCDNIRWPLPAVWSWGRTSQRVVRMLKVFTNTHAKSLRGLLKIRHGDCIFTPKPTLALAWLACNFPRRFLSDGLNLCHDHPARYIATLCRRNGQSTLCIWRSHWHYCRPCTTVVLGTQSITTVTYSTTQRCNSQEHYLSRELQCF